MSLSVKPDIFITVNCSKGWRIRSSRNCYITSVIDLHTIGYFITFSVSEVSSFLRHVTHIIRINITCLYPYDKPIFCQIRCIWIIRAILFKNIIVIVSVRIWRTWSFLIAKFIRQPILWRHTVLQSKISITFKLSSRPRREEHRRINQIRYITRYWIGIKGTSMKLWNRIVIIRLAITKRNRDGTTWPKSTWYSWIIVNIIFASGPGVNVIVIVLSISLKAICKTSRTPWFSTAEWNRWYYAWCRLSPTINFTVYSQNTSTSVIGNCSNLTLIKRVRERRCECRGSERRRPYCWSCSRIVVARTKNPDQIFIITCQSTICPCLVTRRTVSINIHEVKAWVQLSIDEVTIVFGGDCTTKIKGVAWARNRKSFCINNSSQSKGIGWGIRLYVFGAYEWVSVGV